jgi:hypothetical protein
VIVFNWSVRERQGTGYGPVIGTYVGASEVPPAEGVLIEVEGKLRRVVAGVPSDQLDELKNSILVEHYTEPA